MCFLSVRISNILNSLVLNASSNESDDVIDEQVLKILNRIEADFNSNKLIKVLEWFHETVKKEADLKQKRVKDPFVFNKPKIRILILKTNALHSKIIDMLVKKIEYLAEKGSDGDKMQAIDLANTFVGSLSTNRDIDELLYDEYIKDISETMKIFQRKN